MPTEYPRIESPALSTASSTSPNADAVIEEEEYDERAAEQYERNPIGTVTSIIGLIGLLKSTVGFLRAVAEQLREENLGLKPDVPLPTNLKLMYIFGTNLAELAVGVYLCVFFASVLGDPLALYGPHGKDPRGKTMLPYTAYLSVSFAVFLLNHLMKSRPLQLLKSLKSEKSGPISDSDDNANANTEVQYKASKALIDSIQTFKGMVSDVLPMILIWFAWRLHAVKKPRGLQLLLIRLFCPFTRRARAHGKGRSLPGDDSV